MVGTESEYQHLTVGSAVEVTSDEEGFKGAWYGAKILEPFPRSSSAKKKPKKVLVQYKNLVTEDGSELLKEYVDPVHIRPLPPLDLNPSFEENDAIDAFYQDGWWTGVIIRPLDSNKFLVFFDNPPDIIESEFNNLRKHVDWVRGKWVPAKKQKLSTGTIFSPGTAVEVNIRKDDHNSRSAWFPAIFVKEMKKNIFLVKHLSSKEDMGNVFPDEVLAPKLAVEPQHIRPAPPQYEKRSYELLEKVEAYHDFAWRAGLITKVLAEGRYRVFFKHTSKDKELSQSEIRPPVEWIDGKWVYDSKEVLITSDCQENLGHDRNNADFQLGSSGSVTNHIEKKKPCATNSRKDLMELSTPSSESILTRAFTPSTKKIKLVASNGNAKVSQPSKKLSPKESEPSSPGTPSKLRKIVVKTSSEEAVCASATVGTGGRSIKQPFTGNQLSGKTKSPREKPFRIKQMNVNELDTQTDDAGIRIGGRPKRPSVKLSRTSAAGKEENAGTIVMDVVIGLESPVARGSDNENYGKLPVDPNDVLVKPTPLRHWKKRLIESSGNKSTEIKQQRVVGSSQKRKRGRPCKLLINAKGNNNNEVGGITNDMAGKECCTAYEDSLVAVVQTDGEVAEENCASKEVEMASAGTTTTVDDDQPLSTWIGGIHGAPLVDESSKQVDKSDKEVIETSKQVDKSDGEVTKTSKQVEKSDKEVNGSSKQVDDSQKEVKEPRLSSPARAVNEKDKTTDDIPVESPAVNTTSNSVHGENQRLPFVKSSPVWKTIEAMEVFHVLPQNPHFRPLGECKEEYREGSAIGNMITFANLVEKTSKLRSDNPRSAFDSISETLLHLEKHGFEVKPLQARVNDLLSIKNNEQQLQDELKDLDRKIMQHTDEKNKYADEMDEIMRKITELQEKHAAIKSKHNIVDTELAKLQTRSEFISTSTQKAHIEFEKVAAAPWKLA